MKKPRKRVGVMTTASKVFHKQKIDIYELKKLNFEAIPHFFITFIQTLINLLPGAVLVGVWV